MRIVLCDICGVRVLGGVYKRDGTTDDFCSRECSDKWAPIGEEGCQHEDNIDGTTHGMAGKRLICMACGYDRVEAVEEVAV